MKALDLKNGDCKELIKKIPDKSVDLILTDPPYNIARYSTGNIKFDWRSDINNDIAEWDEVPLKPADFVESFKRVLKPTGNAFVFTSYNMVGEWHKAFDDEFDTFQFMAWHKTNPVPNFMKTSFLNSVELIVCFWNKGHTWNFINQAKMHNFIESSICGGGERLKDPKHPAQKPVKVLEHIVKIASNDGDVVFDPFMGVGSTGVAARGLNRRFVGFELDFEYFQAAKKRLSEQLIKVV
ncbi:MAG: site-specific DNA-methyltransferase [Oscillospiraceae bacterium]|jgi:site-specific DNA-methyltransferase (adenine-specific)/modification methylase|nr:site-specific DNA-methyltransferase [Oscillospiraceae bacterium]